MVYTSPISLHFSIPSTALALVSSLAAIPALAFLAAWVAVRAGAAPRVTGRVAGGVPLGVGAAMGLLATALLGGLAGYLGVMVAIPLALASLVLAGAGGALLASRGSRAALREILARRTGPVPPAARALFALAVAACAWSLASTTWWVLAALTHGRWGVLVPTLAMEELPSLAIWALGRVATVGGAVALLRARYAGTLAYSAGLVLVFAVERTGVVPGASLSRPLEWGVQLAALVLAWWHLRPQRSPEARLDRV